MTTETKAPGAGGDCSQKLRSSARWRTRMRVMRGLHLFIAVMMIASAHAGEDMWIGASQILVALLLLVMREFTPGTNPSTEPKTI